MTALIIFAVIAGLVVVGLLWERDTKRLGEGYETEFYALEVALDLREDLSDLLKRYPARKAGKWDSFLQKIETMKDFLASLPANCPTRSYITAVVQTGEKARELLEQPRPMNTVAIAEQAIAAGKSAQQHSSMVESRVQELIGYFEKKYAALNPGMEFVTGPQLQEFHLARAQLNNARDFATYKVSSSQYWDLSREFYTVGLRQNP